MWMYTCAQERSPAPSGAFSPFFVACSEISACNKGILDPVTLQNNYSYVIEK